MQSGSCGFVLSKYHNLKYINIGPGMRFGLLDILSSLIEYEMNMEDIIEDWMSRRDLLVRHFTVVADEETCLLTLSIENLNSMKYEFQETYKKIFMESLNRLQGVHTAKHRTNKHCREIEKAFNCTSHSFNILAMTE